MLTKVLSSAKLNVCRQRVGLMKYPMPEFMKGELFRKYVPLDGKKEETNQV